jgi:protein-S-isoprenylcysteine O-methyltransferase Ste14
MSDQSAYGLWSLVVINSAIVIFFAFSFSKPRTGRDWRSFGAFSAFIVALFTEMYGIPLTIYFLSGWLQSRFPNVDLLSHEAGHIWNTLFGFEGDPHLNPIHMVSNLLLIFGFLTLGSAWKVLYGAQKKHELATSGLYAWVRHPQYIAFTTILLAFLLMWPTILTLVMFPILVAMYIRLARKEENAARAEFGQEYLEYSQNTPAFIPKLNLMSVSKIKSLAVFISAMLILASLPFILTLIVFLTFPIVYMLRTNAKIKNEQRKEATKTNLQ